MFVRLVVALCISLTTIVAAGNAHAATPQNGEDAPHLRVGKWIEVVVADQQLNAWEDGRIVMTTPISTGVRKTPTPRGTFKIYSKYSRARMRGPGYDLPNVPYVMYFKGSYGIHGTYWHNNFGRPMSHGCVNMPTSTAAWLFQWAPKGTSVVVR
jgi:lipoprotein-anchoring transpeptidase ErfK/SrfK